MTAQQNLWQKVLAYLSKTNNSIDLNKITIKSFNEELPGLLELYSANVKEAQQNFIVKHYLCKMGLKLMDYDSSLKGGLAIAYAICGLRRTKYYDNLDYELRDRLDLMDQS